jgi:hypothetical protein
MTAPCGNNSCAESAQFRGRVLKDGWIHGASPMHNFLWRLNIDGTGRES